VHSVYELTDFGEVLVDLHEYVGKVLPDMLARAKITEGPM
jgi:hypothetical protein